MSKGYPVLSSEPTTRIVPFAIEGAGANAPSKLYGKGITVTRTGAGVYKFTFSEPPGHFVAVVDSLQAATPANVKNHSVVWDTFDASTKSIEVTFFDGSGTAHDLVATEFIGGAFVFKESATPA